MGKGMRAGKAKKPQKAGGFNMQQLQQMQALQAQMQAMRLLIGAGTTTAADREALREAIEAAELALQNATGINGVAAFSKGDGTIFNLSGQRVSKPGKGIYIVNGRKVLY